MPAALSNVSGGSLAAAALLTILAWGVRWLHSELLSIKKREETVKKLQRHTPGRFHARLSPWAVRLLVETGPYPHMILDVRENASTSLPGELRGAVRLALNDLTEVLCSQALWRERFQGIQHPASHYMLILIGNNEQEQSNAAAAAAAAGYQRAMSLAGALPPFSVGVAQPHITFINRDALAVLLGLNGLGMPLATLLDVRRSDERVLYGAIRGSVNVPVDQLASALALPPEQFAEQYRFSKPHPEDLLVMSCRTSTRSLWAGHVAADAGFRRVLVYRQGAYGWRLDPSVKPYRGYAVLDPPPEPEEFTLDIADIAAGRLELQQLGIGVI